MNELCFSCCINQCKRYVSEEYIFTKTSVRLSEVMYILRMIALFFLVRKVVGLSLVTPVLMRFSRLWR